MKYIPFITYIFIWTMYVLDIIGWLNATNVANIIGAISAVGTVGALWYAIKQGGKNREDIEKLASIAIQLTDANRIQQEQNDILRQQLKLDYKPAWKIEQVNPDKLMIPVDYTLDIKNIGAFARLESIQDTQGKLKRYPDAGTEVQQNDKFQVVIQVGLMKELPNDYSFSFTYIDALENTYQAMVKFKKGEFFLNNSETKVLHISAAAITASGMSATMTHRQTDGSVSGRA